MKRLIALAMVMVVLTGCQESVSGEEVGVETTSLRRFHDDDMGVTCWYDTRVRRGGVSCLPDWFIRGELP